jgi:glucose/arabinose dehydrogenase
MIFFLPLVLGRSCLMKRLLGVLVVLGCWLSTAAAAEPMPKPLVTGLSKPHSVAVGFDRRIYVTETGGRVVVIQDGKAVPFATDLGTPRGVVAFQQWLFVADAKRIWRIDLKGKATEFAGEKAFPTPPTTLAWITVDETGALYVTDQGDGAGRGSAVFRIDPKGKVTLVVDEKKNPAVKSPGGIVMDGMSHLLVLTSPFDLHRIKIADGTSSLVAEGVGNQGLAWDYYGRLYVSEMIKGNRYVHVIPRPGEKHVRVDYKYSTAMGLTLDPTGKFILVVGDDSLYSIPAQVPGQEVDDTPLPLETAVAFPDLKWEGWKPETPQGKPNPFRPVLLTHAGDGSDRVFVATEQGVIHVFPNDQKATRTQIFLDLQDRVVYTDKQNEEGFLGLAFHPNYKKNGEFFVFYTTKKAKLTNIVSRFRVSKDDPNRADPDSEEVLLKIEKPFWNHDGGTLCFGPDGYLYLTHGDGGDANDPFKNGQNLKTLLGKVLRIDVDHKDAGKNYAIPKDNPFVGRDDARGEIWAYGLRNIWRMSFDKKTGALWAGDVGQNLYEEIDLIVKGGNYGWSVREGLHPFGKTGVGPTKDLIEPIWEYHHDLGKCIIGGHVYRGPRLPELDGYYLYADYVTNKLWALRYDEGKRRVVANRPLKASGVPVLSFGEDEKGEVYTVEESLRGQGIRWLVRQKK